MTLATFFVNLATGSVATGSLYISDNSLLLKLQLWLPIFFCQFSSAIVPGLIDCFAFIPLRRQREPTQHVRRLTEISFVWHEHIAGAPTHRSAESRAQHAHTRAIYIIHTQQRTHASRWHTHTEKQAHTHHAHWPVRRTQSKYVRTESKLASTHASNPAAACAGRR